MRRDRLYLTDIIESADHIAQFLAQSDFQKFQASELLRSAVLQKLGVIGDPQHSYPRVFWNRLGIGVASCQESLPRTTEASG